MATVSLPSLACLGYAPGAAAAPGGAAQAASASARGSSRRSSSSSSSSSSRSCSSRSSSSSSSNNNNSSSNGNRSSSSSSSNGSRRRLAVGDGRGGPPRASGGRAALPLARAEQEHASSSLPLKLSSADESAASAHVVSRQTFTRAAIASLVLGTVNYSLLDPLMVAEAAPSAVADTGPPEQPETAAAPAPAPAAAPAPESDGYVLFQNAKENYSLRVPEGWVTSEGTVGTRKLVAFHPTSTLLANVSVLITMLGADFTSLGSFGTVDAFAEQLVNSQDRSYLRKPGQKAVLIDAKSANKTYYVEYTIQKPGEDKIHLYSAVAIYNNGVYNQLYTLTAQHLEDESDFYKATIQEVVKSFRVAR